MRFSLAARAGALCVLLALSGCSWLPSLPAIHSPFSSPPVPCPATVILRPLRNTAILVPGRSPEPENVAFYGVLDDVASKCEGTTGAAAHVALDVVVVAQRGPAHQEGANALFHYFVAVVGPGDTILAKNPFSVSLAIPPGKLRAGVTDHIEETIPLGGNPVGALRIVLGFQQSPEAVEFYHHFRGR